MLCAVPVAPAHEKGKGKRASDQRSREHAQKRRAWPQAFSFDSNHASSLELPAICLFSYTYDMIQYVGDG